MHPLSLSAARPCAPWLLLIPLTACSQLDPEPALVADTADLPRTTIVATRSEPLDPGSNQLWCAPMALAWEQLGEAVGGAVRVREESAAVERLAAEPFPRADLDPRSYMAFATAGGANAAGRILAARAEAGFAPDGEAEARAATLEGGVAAYAALEKVLSFPTRFEDLPDAPLLFRRDDEAPGVAVDTFGIASFDITEEPHERLREQVAIHETDDRAAWVVRIDTDTGDRVLLARVAPGTTLDASWRAAATLVAEREPERLWMGDSLRVPEFDFALEHAYTELEGLTLANPDFVGLPIAYARQSLRLVLDEEGMVVRSRAEIGVASAVATGPRELHLDRPFLLAAIEDGAETPYLVAWIADPELMQRAATP